MKKKKDVATLMSCIHSLSSGAQGFNMLVLHTSNTNMGKYRNRKFF